MKNNPFLAKTMEQGERQIKTGVKFLEKLTYRESIGTAGYAYGLRLIKGTEDSLTRPSTGIKCS
jgi:hypothetical protein